jgi:hypothetical protein
VYATFLLLALGATGEAAAQFPEPFFPGPGVPILLPCPCLCPPAPVSHRVRRVAPRDVVLLWNDAALAAIRAERTPPPVAARNLAVVHVAVYDAVNAVTRTHQSFRFEATAFPDTSAEAAAAVAAHRALVSLYPRQVEQFDAVLDEALESVPEGAAKTNGIRLGQAFAEKVLSWRGGDMVAARTSSYAPRAGVGRWRPTPPEYRPALLPGWESVPCFALRNAAQFHPPGPPEAASEEFVASYRQVKALGAFNSGVRTREQTEIARFWDDGVGTVTPPGHWNRIAQAVAAERGQGVAENARLFAVLNVALADAAIACWECKYSYDLWRPVTAIRAADRLENPALAADTGWTSLLTTPPFPSYTSGHSTFSAAAAAALANFFGRDDVRFATTSDGLPGVTRSFAGFAAAAREAGLSRIYGGIHWNFDNREGLACGKKVGDYVSANFFLPRAIVTGRGTPATFGTRR